ncbi:MAG: hypothetical protein KY464_11160 [Gemmatimonadetes bacterium]|nr:hypothetical protein [Gemmatimonadota bacterium]
MEQPQDGGAPNSAVGRAADLGERLGRLTSMALRRVEEIARNGIPGPATSRPGAVAPDEKTTGVPSDASATERAEELLAGMGGALGNLVQVAGPGIRKFVALAQEEAEDIWAEAQDLRRSNSRGSD